MIKKPIRGKIYDQEMYEYEQVRDARVFLGLGSEHLVVLNRAQQITSMGLCVAT